MNIEGMGESLIGQLCEQGLVTSSPTSIALTRRRSRASSGWARSPPPRCSARSRSRSRNDVWRLLYGLGIRHVGERGAQVLADHFGSIDAIERASLEELQQVREIGPVLAASVRSWFDEPAQPRADRRLPQAGAEARGRAQGRAGGTAAAGGQDVRDHGHAGRRCRARRRRRNRGARRQGDRLGQQEDDGVDRRRRARPARSRKRARLASKPWMKQGFWIC